MKKIKIYGLLLLPAVLVLCGSCNDEWKDEQYKRYISFKAPLGSNGVSQISMRYKPDGHVTYRIPVVVSGSTANDRDLTVYVTVDSDTLRMLNDERFKSRTDLFFRELGGRYFTMPGTVNIPAGENIGLLDIDFSLAGIDLSDKWVLPLNVVNDPSRSYVAHPRKHYRKALLYLTLFNDFSGIYGGTAIKPYPKGSEDQAPIVKNEIPVYVVDENTVFFYAGMVDENRADRRNYKISASFDRQTGNVTLRSDNPNIELVVNSSPVFSVVESMDATRPYLLHRYITVSGIDYEYKDYTLSPGKVIPFSVKGSMVMERKINTQIPDEDQAIEW